MSTLDAVAVIPLVSKNISGLSSAVFIIPLFVAFFLRNTRRSVQEDASGIRHKFVQADRELPLIGLVSICIRTGEQGASFLH